ncbi:hypothetical protein EYF80_040264 [Liparis tanakae]|uniref:Uncharacterized protein n=1 Tax=Liparis tanakae TaxID=230148 RepID=A0A4Z2G9A6_9TELE|nr:hypothetical protein EYF80_040264 [Liparis tanakae]
MASALAPNVSKHHPSDHRGTPPAHPQPPPAGWSSAAVTAVIQVLYLDILHICRTEESAADEGTPVIDCRVTEDSMSSRGSPKGVIRQLSQQNLLPAEMGIQQISYTMRSCWTLLYFGFKKWHRSELLGLPADKGFLTLNTTSADRSNDAAGFENSVLLMCQQRVDMAPGQSPHLRLHHGGPQTIGLVPYRRSLCATNCWLRSPVRRLAWEESGWQLRESDSQLAAV